MSAPSGPPDPAAVPPTPVRSAAAATAAALARACHPLPTVAVTGFALALGAAAGGSPGELTALGAAVLTGQLAIGWANDAVDADRDTAAGRPDKPVATGVLTRRAVTRAAVLAAALTVPASLLLGPLPGCAHLLGVAAGLAYDLRLKGTLASPVPYLVFFGLLPLVAVTAAGAAPSGLLCAVGATVGLAAHLANTVPDAAEDAAAGVRGLPQRLGPARSRVGSALLVVAGAVVLGTGVQLRAAALAPGEGASPTVLVLLVAAAVTAVVAALGHAHGVFALVLLAAGLLVAAAVAAAGTLLVPAPVATGWWALTAPAGAPDAPPGAREDRPPDVRPGPASATVTVRARV